MDMFQQQPQEPAAEEPQDQLALMKQAYETLGKAIAVAEGGSAEGEQMGVEQAFGQGFAGQ